MLSVPSLLVCATLLVGFRGSAAQNFLARSAYGNSSSVLSVQGANHSEEDAFGVLARELKAAPTWSKLSSPKQSVDWDGVGGATESGVGAITASVEFAKEPSVATAGSALTSIGSLAMLAPPPAGPVLGGLMMLTGGLMSIFGGDQGPSNEDILTAMQSGFTEVNEKLDNIEMRLAAVKAQLNVIERKLDLLVVAVGQVRDLAADIRDDVKEIYEKDVLKKEDMDYIDISYEDLMQRLRLAMKDPNLMEEFTTFAVTLRDTLGRHIYGVLSPNHLEEMLNYELEAENGNCAAAISYQVMVAVRMKVFFMQFMGSIFSCPGSGPCPRMTIATVQAAEHLKEHLLDYERIVKEKGAWDAAQIPASQLSAGMNAPRYVFNANVGHDRYKATHQFVRDAAALPVFGPIHKECTDDMYMCSDTCKTVQDQVVFHPTHRAIRSLSYEHLIKVSEPRPVYVGGKFVSPPGDTCLFEARERYGPKKDKVTKWAHVGTPFRNKCWKSTSPGDIKNCKDFKSYEEAKAWYDTYFPLYGDVAKLDGDNDGIPCEALKKQPSPGDIKNCGDFNNWDEAKAWYDIYFPLHGDVAKLDGDNDGIPCEALLKNPPE